MNTIKIKKKDFDRDLQAGYPVYKGLASLLSTEWGIRLINTFIRFSNGIKRKGVLTEKILIKSRNQGPDIPVVIYKPGNTGEPLPVMLYLHGGGYVTGSPEFTPSCSKPV